MPHSHPTVCGSIAGKPGRFGVAMHTAAYRALGLDWVYVAFGTEDTAAAVAAMRTLGLRGLGVTTPHKLRIAQHLDALDHSATAVGAVNTIVNDEDRLTGHNVDWTGAVRALQEATPLDGRRAAVIGAGGGARAIVYGLSCAGCSVTVFNRNGDKGRRLAELFEATWGGAPEALDDASGFDVLAHATPVGSHAPDDSLVPAEALRPGVVVFDGQLYGRNYGELFLALPLLWAVEAVAARSGGPRVAAVDDAPSDLQSAYHIADQLTARVGEGQPVGWKVGATSEGAQSFLGLSEPIYGRILSRGVRQAPAELTFQNGLEAEPEIIFKLKDGVTAGDCRTGEGARGAIAAANVGLEVNRPSYEKPFEAGALSIVADNAAHAGLIVGPKIEAGAYQDVAVRVFTEGESASEGHSRAVLGDPLRSLIWLASALPAETSFSEAWIATGAMARSVRLSPGSSLVAAFSPGGEVALTVAQG